MTHSLNTERQEIIKAAQLASMKVQAHVDRVKRDYLRLIDRNGKSIKIDRQFIEWGV